MKTSNFISVICPVFNEQGFINDCVKSILAQDYPAHLLEVLFIDGISTDKTREIIHKYTAKYNFIKLLDNPDNLVSYALNIGIKASVGDIIIRIDAHCAYPSTYFSSLLDNLNKLNADNVGGIVITRPANSTAIGKAIATAMSHPFGVGNSFFRIGSKKLKAVDTVPFGCFRRTIFDRIGFFDTDLVRNQDDEYNARIIKNGGKVYLIPSIEITYYARSEISKVGRMFYQYGLFKPLVNRKIGSPTTIRQFIPLLFIFGTVFSSLISLFISSEWIVPALFIFAYILFSLSFSIIHSIRQRSILNLFLLPLVFLVIHLSYGWGYLEGIFHFLILRKNSVSVHKNR